MPYQLQAKLLRVLQEGDYRPVGSNRLRQANVRFIGTTNVDIERALLLRKFREDLFFRMSTIRLEVPPLRDRRDDIPLLVEHLIAQLETRYSAPPKTFAPEAVRILQRHRWPGNVRELEQIVERSFWTAKYYGHVEVSPAHLQGFVSEFTETPTHLAGPQLPDVVAGKKRLTSGPRKTARRVSTAASPSLH